MAQTQTTYRENIRDFVTGQIANTSTCDIDTYVVEGSTGIAFGLAVQIGTGAGKAKKGVDLKTYVGISVKDPTRDAGNEDKYSKGAHASILYRGDICVDVATAVAVGDDVTAVKTTGAISSDATSGTQTKLVGARFVTAAIAGGKAIVRLSGELPTSATT